MNNIKKVRQSNDFIAAPYSTEFSTHEIKLIEYMIADSKDVDKALILNKCHKEFVFSASELSKILNTSLSRIVADADKLADAITNKRIVEKQLDESGNIVDFVYVSIIAYAGYSKGMFKFSFNCHILKYFIDINKNFTEIQLNFVLKLASAAAIKLYKLLYQYKNLKIRRFTVDDLREQFGMVDKYLFYGNFKQSVIDTAVKQINQFTDLNVSYNEIKIGRKIKEIEFVFTAKKVVAENELEDDAGTMLIARTRSGDQVVNKNDVVTAWNEIQGLLGGLVEEISFATKQLLLQYYHDHGVNYLVASISYAQKYAKTNIDKYLADTLQNGWAELEAKKLIEVEAKQQAIALEAKQQATRKQLEKEQISINKSLIEHEWNKLLDQEKLGYINYAEHILHKHSNALGLFDKLKASLHLSIYAISHDKNYDKVMESYLQDYLKINLNLRAE